jgi:Homeodomain
LDFHQPSAHSLQCHNQQPFEADQPLESLQSFKPQFDQLQQLQQPQQQQQPQESNLLGNLGMPGSNQPMHNPYNTEQMQEFLLQKFSTQDFDLLTKNYDFFLQYYKTNCPNDQQMDEKHLTMDFLSQFYHLNEFKKKLNGSEMELEENASADEMQNDNDDVVALDDKEEIDFSHQNPSTDASKGKMSISSYNSNKRLRTTILPEQLNYLYECYQKESNPSRKQLEEISKKVNLKKRVVQVSRL